MDDRADRMTPTDETRKRARSMTLKAYRVLYGPTEPDWNPIMGNGEPLPDDAENVAQLDAFFVRALDAQAAEVWEEAATNVEQRWPGHGHDGVPAHSLTDLFRARAAALREGKR